MQVSLISGGLDAVKTDVLVLPVFEDWPGSDSDVSEVDADLDGELNRALSDGQVSGKLHRVTTLLTIGKLSFGQLMLVGAGQRAAWNQQRARTVAGTAVRQLRTANRTEATILLPSVGDTTANLAAMVHGAEIANFSPGQYKTRENGEPDVERLAFLAAGPDPALSAVIEKSRVIGEAANMARTLANEPGNRLTPTVFAERAEQVAREHGLSIEIMDEDEMQARGYGAILGVSRGSEEPAKLVTIRYEGGESAPTVGLVGKGITFDSGGISIKPADRMHLMKTDMSGAAAVLGAMQAIAQLRPDANVVAVLCLSENLPGGTAMKPGDVLVAGNGMTIEVINTDAEGRLVLADGLAHARSQGATHLVDVATLTGACVVALGTITTGVFGSSQPWIDLLLAAADHTGEKMWQLPLSPEYREQMNSEIADIANAGGREGGAITAAAFLKEFAGDSPWVHLDIAGTARNAKDVPYMSKGPTGVAVATLTRLVESVGEQGIPA